MRSAMRNENGFGRRNLEELYQRTEPRPLSDDDRLVFFSDIHLGNGGRTDDFLPNSDLFREVVSRYYLEAGHVLVLNGDIEELQRFSLPAVLERWSDIYSIFDRFRAQGRLLRLVGNHDMALLTEDGHDFEIQDALRYTYGDHTIFVFHGHQTEVRFERYNHLVGFGLKYFANPLRIKNYSVAHDSVKRFRAEQRVYEFASANRVVAIMGHTHRPLFESMSKVDSLKFEIERLCRKYPKASARKQRTIESTIADHKAELRRIQNEEDDRASVASLYDANLLIPCTFNSGTVIGKSGMTCLEIESGMISLVHWFDAHRATKYLSYGQLEQQALHNTAFHRVVLKADSLDYIFTRIKLLAG